METGSISTQLALFGGADPVPWWGWVLAGVLAAEAIVVWSLCRAAARLDI